MARRLPLAVGMSNVSRVISVLGILFAVASAQAATPVREVSGRKIVKAGGRYQLHEGESKIAIRVKESQSVTTRDAKPLKRGQTDKPNRIVFIAAPGKYLADLGKGPQEIEIVKAGKAEKKASKKKDEPREERRERPRLNPDIERYTTDGKIDFSKLHRGLYGSGF